MSVDYLHYSFHYDEFSSQNIFLPSQQPSCHLEETGLENLICKKKCAYSPAHEDRFCGRLAVGFYFMALQINLVMVK